MQVQIETLCNWSAPTQVDTRNGPRNLRKASPTSDFWTAWKSSKDQLKAAGVSCSKRDGDWEACWWLPLEEAQQKQIEEVQAASRATDADIELPRPEGLEYLGYQKAGIAYALDRPSVLIGDEMGLGKTIQAIGVYNADSTISRVLIVCPASLRLNWQREWAKWATRPAKISVVNGGKASDWPKDVGEVVVINFDILSKHRKQIDSLSWDMLVVDECHYLKNPKAVRTKAVLGATSKGTRTAEGIKARRKLFLTGTPIVNRPVELWPLVETLDPDGLGKNFFGFAKRFCNATQTRWGWDFSGSSNLDELQRKLREKFMVRRLKANVLKELPAKRRQVIAIPANGASKTVQAEMAVFEQYETLQALLDSDVTIDDETGQEIRQQMRIAFEEMSRTRHETALAKVPHVIEYVSNLIDEQPIVLFAHHKDVIQQIADHFGNRCVTLTGETKMEDRQAAVDAFQTGKVDLFIGNIQAAGVGITLTRASLVVFAELDWVPGNLSQAEDRLHRIGQTQSVLVQHIVLEGSVDSVMAEKIIAKQEVIKSALDEKTTPDYGTNNGITEVNVSDKVIEAEQKKQEAIDSLTPEQTEAIHLGLRMLAGSCDGARSIDGAGFNKLDTYFGKELASRSSLTPRQALAGQKLVRKYRRQLPSELLTQAGV